MGMIGAARGGRPGAVVARGARSGGGGSRATRGRGRRSAAEAGGTRERLLRQAERLFARKGYGATSLRELARAGGVRMFTIQHHFGSKRALYEEVLRRWDDDVEALVARVLDGAPPEDVVARVVDALFDFFVANRARVALNARAALGEGIPRRVSVGDRGWVRFMSAGMARQGLGGAEADLGLLLITIEGVLHNHVLASPHYRFLFGRDVTDPQVATRVKRHLKRVIPALLERSSGTPHPDPLPVQVRGAGECSKQEA